MFNYLKVALMGLVVCLMASCQNEVNEIEEPTAESAENVVELTSSMSQEDFLTACAAVKSKMGSVSRAVQMTDVEARQVMQPFVEDGLQLRTQIVRQVELEPTMAVEAAYFRDLSEEDCAALSFVFHSIKDAGLDTEIVTGTIDGFQAQTMSVSSERLLHCAAVAVGYDAIKRLGVGGIVTATTVRQAIIAIGKRYLGYVGLALMVYDFVECVS
ncbi:hypothetical protein [uncultured Duncaniella sp.]|uniref:hypothetical protein n=1 Tax=uncultured Duncaniella sp. TaxID=2768039 RepID=UPI0025AA29B7|nr:hypothetical protein [uncultured Duncaniella sp.]